MISKKAFVFPGQGSQKIGMLADIAAHYAEVETTFALASEVLGYDLWRLCQQGEQEAINQTEVTQPLLLTASTALWRIWQAEGGQRPDWLAGHSLGEWSALVAAEALRFEDAVRMVRLRGQYMQEAVPAGQGAMAAIVGLEDNAIEAVCSSISGEEFVGPVNYNSPGQVVIAGHAAAVEKAIEACRQAGARRALPLPVSAPFHTPLMRPAAERLAADLDGVTFQSPKIPLVHNVGVGPESEPAQIRQRMLDQITAPVPWVACVNRLKQEGCGLLLECGPGKVLAGLSKRIAPELATINIDGLDSLQSALRGES